MTIRPFETLERLRGRMAEAVISQSGLRVPVLADHLRKTLAATSGEGALLRQPVLEGAFPFVPASEAIGELAGKLLDERTIAALAGDGSGLGYSFPRTRAPYRHQLEAWNVLAAPESRSAVVTAGTGSGKTECFLVPLLDSLYRRTERISGVEAIMLYPLNALIASQQERLDAWTRGASGRIRYCLYNGNLEERLESRRLREALQAAPQTVPDRRTLRADPPPLLVTNITMLEYMLVRPQDRPILAASKGRLKWIILDEAHTLVGSAAAEVALLLRRVMEAFEVDPASVRFVATSATIGEGPAINEQLRRFLADVGGIDPARVDVVVGERRLPTRPPVTREPPDAEAIRTLSPSGLYDRLGGYAPVWSLVETLKSATVPAESVQEIAKPLGVDGETLAMALTRARSTSGETLAPLRVHSFHRAVPGLWCCTDSKCRDGLGAGWAAGRILFERREACPTCHMPVAELFTCNECGNAFMMAEEIGDRLIPLRPNPPDDEFLFESERDTEEDEVPEAEPPAQPDAAVRHCFSLSGRGLRPLFVDRTTGLTCDGVGDNRYRLDGYGDGTGACPCCGAANGQGDKLYPFRFGAPFIISNAAPILLAAMPPSDRVQVRALPQSLPDLPADGRQLISFTDSRQGTARMAAKLQIDSERTFVRSFIVQSVQHGAKGKVGTLDQADALMQQIAAIEAVAGWRDGPLAKIHESLTEQLAGVDGGSGTVGWTTLRNSLADRPEIREWLSEVWGDRADLFRKGSASAAAQLADALLLRELMRRPRNANSVETMGLARLVYPAIERLTDAPRGFRLRGGSVDDWKGWLTALATFSVRNALAVAVPRDVLQWIMRKGFPKSLASPGREPGRFQQSWPHISLTKKPVVGELLRLGLGLNFGSASDREEANAWLAAAWRDMQPLFPTNANGEQMLDFTRLEVGAISRAFHCPVTKRIVDTAPFGLTPYAKTPKDKAEPITWPSLPSDADEAERRHFLHEDDGIASLRRRGLWTDMHDRIALFSPYARSAEHSAQLSPPRLRQYEKDFRSGLINFLNCSTTMEMGVDIGSVNGVMMTNVPPSIANYRQRVGRAGRRGQPLSLAFTFAKDRPSDREAFRSPETYLTRTIAAPRVERNSRAIVQRHVNAFLLGRFLAANNGDALHMTVGDFFGCPSAPRAIRPLRETRPVAQVVDWLSNAATGIDLGHAIERLVRGSIAAGRSDLMDATRLALLETEMAVVEEWARLQEQIPDADAMGAAAAIRNHLSRLCGEFLLSDLADRGFLPGHGFPNNVVTFELARREPNGPEDARPGQRHGGPKRPLDVAIRDYAPGAETVVDGQVYRVGGVTLNWHRPSSEQGVREIQALRWAAHCTRCGDNWTGMGGQPECCRTCDASDVEVARYLKPAGFLRDLREPVHAEIDRVDFVPAEPPRISAGMAPWEALSSPHLGRVRLNRRGSVFYHSKGPTRAGYGLCLHCGRMEPMDTQGALTCTGLTDHRPLRAEENFAQTCLGNTRPFAVQVGLELGYELHTDVLELQPAQCPTAVTAAANALAIALREASARHLGIEPDEIGYGIAPSRNALAAKTVSIFLFDRASGGAGYVVAAAPHIRALLRRAREILDCPLGCATACSACVLVSDGPERESDLDRRAAIAFIDGHLRLPEDLPNEDRFAVDAEISERPLAEIDDRLQSGAGGRVVFWARTSDITTLDDWPPTAVFRSWSTNGKQVVVVLPEGTVANLDAAQRLFLRDFRSRHGIELAEGGVVIFDNAAALFALVSSGAGSYAWACRDEAVLVAGSSWATDHRAIIARAQLQRDVHFAEIPLESLQPLPASLVCSLDATLDGPIGAFGKRMSDVIRQAALACGGLAGGSVAEVRYQDRYARSPLVLKLLLDTIAELADGNVTTVLIQTAPDRGGRSRSNVASDIERDDHLAAFARSYGDAKNLVVSLEVEQLRHKRSLTLIYPGGLEIVVDLDQGFGWLAYDGQDRSLPPDLTPPSMAQRMQRLQGMVQRRHDHDSQMVVWRLQH